MNMMQTVTLAPHPLAEALPLMSGTEFAELLASIEAHGQRDPILLFESMILDGRHRYRACLQLGIEPRIEEFTGTDPVDFVIDKNLRRRHLEPGQIAMAVEKLATLSRGNPHKRLNPPVGGIKTCAEIAASVGIGERTLQRAQLIREHGTPEEISAVENGSKSIRSIANNVQARRRPAGRVIKIPKGTTLSRLGQDGIDLQNSGVPLEKIYPQIGLSRDVYSNVRDVVLLSQRTDLNKRDTELAAKALREMDDANRVQQAWDSIKPIVARVWGKRRGDRLKVDKQRLQQFKDAISLLLSTCESAAKIDIPHLDHDRAERSIQFLDDATKVILQLRNRIKEAQHE